MNQDDKMTYTMTRSQHVRLLFRRLPFSDDVDRIIFEYLFTYRNKRIFEEIRSWLSCSMCHIRLFNDPYDIRRKGFFVDENDYDDYMFQRKFKKYYKNPTLSSSKKYIHHICSDCTSCWCNHSLGTCFCDFHSSEAKRLPCRCRSCLHSFYENENNSVHDFISLFVHHGEIKRIK